MRSIRGKLHMIIWILPLVVVMCIKSSFAQDSSQVSKDKELGLNKGSWALQFAIAGNFQLTNFQGGIISIKHHLSPSRAIRLGLSLMENSTDSHIDESTVSSAGDVSDVFRDQNRDQQAIGIFFQYVIYPMTHAKIHPYWGLGPRLEYSRDHAVTHNGTIRSTDPIDRETLEENIGRAWTTGVTSLFGVEWFAGRKVSISAEYGIQAAYTWNKSSNVTVTYPGGANTNRVTRSNTFLFNGSGVKFGLTAYF